MINKFVLLLSEIMVTWIFRYYHIVHEMHSMWFMWFSHRWYKSQVLCKLRIYFVVGDEIGYFICEDYNISITMICLDHGSGDF